MPAQGMTLELLLQPGWSDEAYTYGGFLQLGEDEKVELEVTVRAGQKWQAEVSAAGGAMDAKLEGVIAALARSAVRSCVVRGQRPPRRVRRWRPRTETAQGGGA